MRFPAKTFGDDIKDYSRISWILSLIFSFIFTIAGAGGGEFDEAAFQSCGRAYYKAP